MCKSGKGSRPCSHRDTVQRRGETSLSAATACSSVRLLPDRASPSQSARLCFTGYSGNARKSECDGRPLTPERWPNPPGAEQQTHPDPLQKSTVNKQS